MSAEPAIMLDAEQRGERERIVRASSSEVRLERAPIVLRCADGRSVEQITGELGCSPPTVAKWRGRYARHGIDGLREASRSGPPLTHDPRPGRC